MADSFFKLKDSLNEFDEKYHDLEEDEYDALNDETFGADATVSEDDWEDMHTRLAAATESHRGRDVEMEINDELDVEKSLSQLVLSDNDTPTHVHSPVKTTPWAPFGPSPLMFDKPFQMPLPHAQPARIMTVEEIERQMIEKEKISSRPTAPMFRNLRPQFQQQPPLNRPAFPQGPNSVFPGYGQQMRPQNPHPFPTGPFLGPQQRPPGFMPNMMQPLMNKPIGRPHPHPIPGKPGMGMYPGPMPPHFTAQDLLLRAQLDSVGMPLIMHNQQRGMMPPAPPPGLVMDPLRLNLHMQKQAQARMFGNMPTHPLLIAHYNQQKILQQQQQQQQQQQKTRHNDRDNYAKLMNNRERTWVLTIQMMTLALDNPSVDDYYYYMWKKRHPVPIKPKPVKNGFHKDQKRSDGHHRERRDSENTNSSQRVYVPLQFENSLGKLQAKSVNAPRMVFDVEMVSDSQTGPQSGVAHKDHRKTKKILLELERLYLLMIEAEEAGENLDVSKKDLVNKVLIGLLNEERFLSFLCIRKGKTLFLRCFGHVTNWDLSMFNELWAKLLKAFPTVLRRDKDDVMLPKFYPFFKQWADATNWNGLLLVAKSLLAGTRDGRTSIFRASPSPSKPVLSYILTNQFGISAVAKIVHQGELLATLLRDHETVEWKSFVEELVKSMGNLDPSERVLRPIEPIAHNIMAAVLEKRCSHLATHLQATARKLLSSSPSS